MALGPELGGDERLAVDRFVASVRRAVGAETTWDASFAWDASAAAFDPAGSGDLVVWCRGDGSDVPVGPLAAVARKALFIAVRNPEHLARLGAGSSTLRLAPALWSVGRVRDHAYLGAPAAVRLALAAWRGTAASEVLHAPVPAIVRRASPIHAFVVDTTPRTPQARRHLRTVGSRPSAGRTDV